MQYWKKVDEEGNTTTVESCSYPHIVPNAVQITKEEYDAYIASLPEPSPPEPTPDELRATEILSHSPTVILLPEVWELLRIFGKKLGYEFD